MKKLSALFLVSLLAIGAAFAGARKLVPSKTQIAESKAKTPPELHFVDIGEGLYTDAMLTEWYRLQPVTYKVRVQAPETGEPYYRIIAPYGQAFADAMLEVNNIALKDTEYDKEGSAVLEIDVSDPDNVYFPKTFINANWGEGDIYIGIPSKANVILKDGIISAPPRGVAVGDDGGAVAMNVSGKFRIVLPGAEATDFELTLTPASHCVADGKFAATLNRGNDIAKVYYSILPDFQEDEMLYAYSAVMDSKMVFPFSGDFSYELSGAGKKETLVLVGVDAAGDEVAYAWTSYYDITADDDQWTSLGLCSFTDPFLPALTSADSETLDVEVQKHNTIDGYLRIVNPYAASKYVNQYTFPGCHGQDADHKHYIYINGTDPECIYIEESPLGIDLGWGMVRANSFVNYFLQAGYEMDECKELELGGILDDDNVLTFPEEALCASMMGYDNADWYITDPEKGDFALALPKDYSFAGVGNVTTDTVDGPATYYNLQGQPVNPARVAPGTLVVRRQGNTATKTVIR